MRKAAATLRGDVERLAATITAEMGKTLAESRAEVEKCAFCCDYFADNAERFLAAQEGHPGTALTAPRPEAAEV